MSDTNSTAGRTAAEQAKALRHSTAQIYSQMLHPGDQKIRMISIGVALGVHIILGIVGFFMVHRVTSVEEEIVGPVSIKKVFIPPPPPPEMRQVVIQDVIVKVPLPDPKPDEPEPIVEEDDVVIIPDANVPLDLGDFGDLEGPPAPAGPLIAGVDATMPVLIPGTRIEPEYPEMARRTGVEGRVIMQAVIRKDGTVGDIQVLRTPQPDLGFSDAANAAVKQWRYQPARQGDRPVDVYFTIVVDFRID